MKIIISPAKKMKHDFEDGHPLTTPIYLDKTHRLLAYLKSLSLKELQILLACNEKIALLNYERFQKMDLKKHTTAALLSYEGIQYQYMAPQVFEEGYYRYVSEHLRILSGFYGILKPFDGIVLYRLEMQAKLKTDFCDNLYDFWQDDLYRDLKDEVIVNLASKEYSQAIKKYVAKENWIDVSFKEEVDGKLKEKGVYVKMARGEMVRFMATRQINDLEGLKQFDGLGYTYNQEASSEGQYVFSRKEKEKIC